LSKGDNWGACGSTGLLKGGEKERGENNLERGGGGKKGFPRQRVGRGKSLERKKEPELRFERLSDAQRKKGFGKKRKSVIRCESGNFLRTSWGGKIRRAREVREDPFFRRKCRWQWRGKEKARGEVD